MTQKRKYSSRGYVHIFGITYDGGICFYTMADCLVWFTLFCTLARKYHVKVLAVCIMLNHFHIEAWFPSREAMSCLMRDLNSRYTQQYTRHYGLKGALFRERYGNSLKLKEQRIKDNFVYICNNPIGKKAVARAEQYRWNFLAYMMSDHPFSDPVIIRKCSRLFLCARSEVLRRSREGQPLGYVFFEGLYENLSVRERKQMVDLIISSYNAIDYEEICKVWGGYDQLCGMLRTVSGSEYDLVDDESAEDYRRYYQMIRIVEESGFDIRHRRFTGLPDEEIGKVARILADNINATKMELTKFLHCPFLELFGIQ
ncbi:MAG: transposase [Bacteroidales bacterium]|nr:transposase [Bacteroidales bacterium]